MDPYGVFCRFWNKGAIILLKVNYNSPEWMADLGAAFSGTVVHLFALTNVIHNYDDIFV